MHRGLAAAGAGAFVALVAGASVAYAAPPNPPVVSEGAVSVQMSAGNKNPPLLSGHFHVDDPNATVTVKATMSWVGPAPDKHPTFTPLNVCPSSQCSTDSNGNVNIAGFPLQPALYNGPYHVDATASATDVFGQGDGTAKTDFGVAVPPPDVTGVTAVVNKDRTVTVSWDRDATTPDVQSYWVYRKGPGEADFHPRFQALQVPNGARITADPDKGTLNAGGDYLYEVETHRNGATGDGGSFVVSNRSAKTSVSNKVTVPNPPPGATTIPQPAPSQNGPPPVVKGTPSGVNRSSGFSSSGSSSATTPTTESVTPDPGFQRGLPYAGTTPGADNSEGDNSAIAQTPGRHTSSGKGYLVPVAGGAVLFLGALHMRLLKKRLDEPPTNLTPVG